MTGFRAARRHSAPSHYQLVPAHHDHPVPSVSPRDCVRTQREERDGEDRKHRQIAEPRPGS